MAQHLPEAATASDKYSPFLQATGSGHSIHSKVGSQEQSSLFWTHLMVVHGVSKTLPGARVETPGNSS